MKETKSNEKQKAIGIGIKALINCTQNMDAEKDKEMIEQVTKTANDIECYWNLEEEALAEQKPETYGIQEAIYCLFSYINEIFLTHGAEEKETIRSVQKLMNKLSERFGTKGTFMPLLNEIVNAQMRTAA